LAAWKQLALSRRLHVRSDRLTCLKVTCAGHIRSDRRSIKYHVILLLALMFAELASVAGFISAAFQDIDKCSVVVTVSTRVYMSFIADVVSNDCCEEHYGSEECIDDDFGGVEYEDVAEREKNQDVSGTAACFSSSAWISRSSPIAISVSPQLSFLVNVMAPPCVSDAQQNTAAVPASGDVLDDWAEDYDEDDYWHFDDANVIMTYDRPYSHSAKVCRVD
jgi:hypothetical protein